MEKKRKIEVSYDGEYPLACHGRLIIKIDEKEVYNKAHCCVSTGSVSFDDDWNGYVYGGVLLWEDRKKFDKEIQKAVKKELSKVSVCCGGCL